jgi:hypothetical protein
MVTGQGWVLPIVGPTYEGGSTLRRQMHNRDTALRRLYSRGETPLHPFDNPTKAVTGHLSATRRVSPIGEVEARTPAGMISLPPLALNIVQRRVVIPGRHSSKSDPSSYIEEPRISLPGVGGERSGTTEANSETGIVLSPRGEKLVLTWQIIGWANQARCGLFSPGKLCILFGSSAWQRGRILGQAGGQQAHSRRSPRHGPSHWRRHHFFAALILGQIGANKPP